MTFDEPVVSAVTAHMNGDHPDDNLLIARAFGRPDAATAVMTGLDGDAGVWLVDGTELRVPWPGGPITQRAEIRREVVVLYDAACAELGVEPREH